MSKHWNPDDAIGSRTKADGELPLRKAPWPDGATAGLALIAACCLAAALVLYQVASPRDVVEEGAHQARPD